MIRIIKIVILPALLAFCFAGAYAQSKPPVRKRPAGSALGASMTRGKIVYGKVCIACHMADGNGVPNMNPPLVKTSYVLGDKKKLIGIVLHGFNEDVEINGQTFSNSMTPHAELSDQQIADVLTYVRNNFGNKASRVTPAEVKKVRASGK
ncbi:MAG TPA: cytochrome c [Mucilaginibacter sp.]|nr:cytochrome c [Mucilaginibacter sp.]